MSGDMAGVTARRYAAWAVATRPRMRGRPTGGAAGVCARFQEQRPPLMLAHCGR